MKRKIVGILVVTLLIASVLVSVFGSAIDANLNENHMEKGDIKTEDSSHSDCLSIQTTKTGPLPPSDCGKDIDPSLLINQKVIDGVPAYEWHHGCSPTSAGMIIGYWDAHGYDKLVDGSASYQTSAVNSMIASSGNYYDYCLPLDKSNRIIPDKSEPPFGDEHNDNSVADFIGTSQSYEKLWYGASWISHIDNGIQEYINWKYPKAVAVVKNKGGFTRLSWETYCGEIDANRPVVLHVDCNGDGDVDHSIAGIGYDENQLYYGCYNTWDTYIHWYEWGDVEAGKKWGVYGGTLCSIKNIPNKPSTPEGTDKGKTGETYNYSTSTIDIDGDQVKFGWNWTNYVGNEELTVDEWTEFYESGETCIVSHSWKNDGNYVIRVKAVDIDKAESDWSDPLSVSMPKNKAINPLFIKFLERVMEQFPLIARLLQLPVFNKLLNLQ